MDRIFAGALMATSDGFQQASGIDFFDQITHIPFFYPMRSGLLTHSSLKTACADGVISVSLLICGMFNASTWNYGLNDISA
ncbi:MAG: hypothetical protein P8M22_04685 [Phycisphaerales bacterium]|nr:hypothetical protein [Phycisphaerales bacterium]